MPTLRGAVVACLASFFLIGPARLQSDIIATIIGFGLVAAIFGAGLLTFYSWLRVKSGLAFFLEGPPEVHARSQAMLTFKTFPFSLMPFTLLSVKFTFSKAPLLTSEHRLKGKNPNGQILLEPLVFPHRGLWRISHATATLGDQLGLWRKKWEWTSPELQSPIRVMAPEAPPAPIPAISSASRAGDSTSHNQHPLGDLFDLRAYQPTDGMRKIVWKIFARSGELISRHPERAMTPEGLTILFVAAGREDDVVARQSIAYVKHLEELGLTIVCGVAGMKKQDPATDHVSLEELLLESVWEADTANAAQGEAEITHLLNQASLIHPGHFLTQVVIFTSPPASREQEHYLLSLGQNLSSHSINPIMIPILDESKGVGLVEKFDWKSLLIDIKKTPPKTRPTYASLARICNSRGWELVVPHG